MIFRTAATLLIMSATLAAADTTPDASVSRSLSVQQAALATVAPVQQSIGIRTQLDNADGRYQVGDAVELSVTLDRPAHLTVFNVSQDGDTTILFPNRFNRESYVAGNAAMSVPGEGARMIVNGPAGLELIKVIASEEPIDISMLGDFRDTGTFAQAGPRSADVVARALTVAAAAPSNTTGTARIGSWGEATISLLTEPARPATVVQNPGSAVTLVPVAPLEPSFALSMSSGQDLYQVGTPLELTVSATRDCDLTLISFGSDGSAKIVFPGAGTPSPRVSKDQALQIRGLTAGPLSKGTDGGLQSVKGFCSTAGVTSDGTAQAFTPPNVAEAGVIFRIVTR